MRNHGPAVAVLALPTLLVAIRSVLGTAAFGLGISATALLAAVVDERWTGWRWADR